MDNYFDLIIILFVIFSILSTLLGRKRKTAQTGRKDSSDETVEEIFGFKLPKSPDIPGEIIHRGQKETHTTTENETWNPEADFGLESAFPAKSESETGREDYKKFKEGVQSRKPQKIVIASPEIIRETRKDTYTGKIIDKFKNPADLREIILLTEILGKPKSRRR